jgi:SAM-dependent methyltransferase
VHAHSRDSQTPPRALSFGAVAEEYDRYRPAPPQAALDWLLPVRIGVALDVGAGTGALTRVLLARAEEVTAIEPDSRMHSVIARRLPQVRLLEGRAESLPLPDASVDAVLISSAWHWMDPQWAVPEVARVLRSGGVFAIIWNGLDQEAPLGAALRQAARGGAARPRAASPAHRPEHIFLPKAAPFARPEIRTVKWLWHTSPQRLAGLMGTYSWVITLPARERKEVLDRVTQFVATQPQFVGRKGITVPAACHCWKALRH